MATQFEDKLSGKLVTFTRHKDDKESRKGIFIKFIDVQDIQDGTGYTEPHALILVDNAKIEYIWIHFIEFEDLEL